MDPHNPLIYGTSTPDTTTPPAVSPPPTIVMPEQTQNTTGNLAVEVIRSKLHELYQKEPNAVEEEREAETVEHRSKHQQFMYELSRSGKPLAQIQTEWHNYYTALPETEKHVVWQEFYAAHEQAKRIASTPSLPNKPANTEPDAITEEQAKALQTTLLAYGAPRTVSDIRRQLIGKVSGGKKLTTKQHLHSLLFGLSAGLIIVVIMLFGFFNERFIAPFMTPSRTVSSSSIIFDPSNQSVGPDPEIIIPKINVQVPVVYDVKTIAENAVQTGLQKGVVHYATTPLPGEQGNSVIFGHSANNILNKGDYKFAFVLLNKLVVGDTFYVNYEGTQYGYKVFERKIVPPSDLSVLNTSSRPVTMTLITCDPPGTSYNRLVVVAEQISPNPSTAKVSSVNQDTADKPVQLPSNSPSLWGRIWSWLSS